MHSSMSLILLLSLAAGVSGQPQTGVLRGTVLLNEPEAPLHHATVTIVQLRRAVETGDDGQYVFKDVPPGRYDVYAHMHAMHDERKTVEIAAGDETTLDFRLRLAAVHEEVTVTASGREQTGLETFQSVTALDSLELATRPATSLGEVVQDQPGVAKRSFGPGNSRPVIRGFDGDRVLVLQDGVRTGTISSQSGDHGEPVDPGSVDQVEIVKGPATLLYGSNAIGGVVNVITGHHQVHGHPHEGLRGYVTGNAGSANSLAGGSAGFELGSGHWLGSMDGGAQRTGDYSTPVSSVPNSHTRMQNVFGSIGRYGDRNRLTVNYGIQDGRYGVPFGDELVLSHEADPHLDAPGAHEHGDIDLTFRRQNWRANYGRHRVAPGLEQLDVNTTYTDWRHTELEGAAVGTRFFNKQFIANAMLEQSRSGRFSGRFGASGMARDYRAEGAERLSPPVDQRNAAVFGIEEVDFERVKLQFGGRYEYNGYTPQGAVRRTFNGFSGAAGANIALWQGGALAANYTHSYRAPALEELYNFGPHVGNLTFEIGNALLKREAADGIDLSLRHQSNRFRAEVNLFRYDLADYVYLAPTGKIEEGLIEATYQQADARYQGTEAHIDTGVMTDLWLHLGVDYVSAKLKHPETPLPRIPPLRGRIALDYRRGGFGFRPEWVLSDAQNAVFPTETRTAGFGLANLTASYSYARQHALHVFSVAVFNATDRLYRNHLSFIKELAPEIGRGVRISYTVRLF